MWSFSRKHPYTGDVSVRVNKENDEKDGKQVFIFLIILIIIGTILILFYPLGYLPQYFPNSQDYQAYLLYA